MIKRFFEEAREGGVKNNFYLFEGGGKTFFHTPSGGGKQFFSHFFESPQLTPHVYIAASLRTSNMADDQGS